MNRHILLIFIGALLWSAATAQNQCTPLAVGGQDTSTPLELYFGAKDSPTNESYVLHLECCWWTQENGDFFFETEDYMDTFMYNIGNFWVNQVPIIGGKNWTNLPEGGFSFNPTALFECGEDGHSGLWGPSYPSYRERDEGERGQYENIEAYVHYSAPEETSYVRFILFLENIGSSPERIHLWSDWYTNDFGLDISPFNAGRYFVPFPYQEGDLGQNGDDPASSYSRILSSIHARGPKARDTVAQVYADMDDYIVSFVYNGQLQPGEKMAFMTVVGFGRNRTQILDTAAMIDSEGADLFHGLSADQLSLIINWGACEVVLSSQVNVTVSAPSQCSQGDTSNFNVQTSTARDDFTSDFTHRVLSGMNEIIAAQSSTTLTVPNNAGSLTHQLWYKQCLIKETSFSACTVASVPVATPASVSQSSILSVSIISSTLIVLALL